MHVLCPGVVVSVYYNLPHEITRELAALHGRIDVEGVWLAIAARPVRYTCIARREGDMTVLL